MKLWHKILAGSLVALGLGIVAAFLMLHFTQQGLKREVTDATSLVADRVMEEVDRAVYYRLEQVQQHADVLREAEVLQSSNQRFQTMENREDFINTKDQQWQAGEATSTINEVLNNSLSQKIKQNFQRKDFYQQGEGYSLFPEVFLTNKYGAVVAATNETSDFYQADENWWQQAKENGLYVGKMRYEPSTGDIGMDLAVRVENEAGEFQGVFLAVLHGEDIKVLLKEAKKRMEEFHSELEHAEFHLLDEKRKVIYSTSEHEFGKEFPYDFCREKPEGGCKQTVRIKDKGSGDILLTHAHTNGYQQYLGRGWSLVIEEESEEVFKVVEQMRRKMLLLIAVTVLIILGVHYVIAKKIAGPEEKLRKRENQLKKFARLASGREERMIELKKEINRLNKKLDQKPPFDLGDIEESGGQ